MKWFNSPIVRALLFIPPVLIGVVVVVLFVLNRRQVEQKPIKEAVRVLQVIQVPEVKLVPRVIGYGTAQPGRIWRAVARVRGHVVFVHENLQAGSFIKKDQLLIQIDKTEYNLAAAQLKAEIEKAKAQIKEMAIRKQNFEASLKIVRRSLKLKEKKLRSTITLRGMNAASDDDVDAAESDMLSVKQSAQSLQNSLNTLPEEKKALRASLDVKENKLKQVELDLERTTIKAPFDCRLSDVSIEMNQFLAAGEKLFEAYSNDLAEIDVQLPIDRGRNLIDPSLAKPIAALPDLNLLKRIFNVQAIVRMHSGNHTTEWKGEFVRIRERLDPLARTVGVVIAVRDPYKNAIPGKRVPLVKGAFCEVELRTRARTVRVIPRQAVQNGSVFVLDEHSRLRRRQIEIDFSQSDFLVVKKGLNTGETLVVSDPTPAIDGMLVEPSANPQLVDSLRKSAAGKGAIK